MKVKYLLLAAVWALCAAGCGNKLPEPVNRIEAQRVYHNTQWYFTRPLASPSNMIPGATNWATPGSSQFLLESPSGSRLIYTEYVPQKGMKSFRGVSALASITNMDLPVFLIEDSSADHQNRVRLAGFVRGRMFTVEAKNGSDVPNSRALAFEDAVVAATNAWVELLGTTRKQL